MVRAPCVLLCFVFAIKTSETTAKEYLEFKLGELAFEHLKSTNCSCRVLDPQGAAIGCIDDTVQSDQSPCEIGHSMPGSSQAGDLLFQGFRMLLLDAPVWLGESWTLLLSWRPCRFREQADRASPGDNDGTCSGQCCIYPDQQRVLAFAKSVDGTQGVLLLTRWGEVGVFTNGTLTSVPWAWSELMVDTFQELRVVGGNGFTVVYANGVLVASVPAQVRNLFVARVGGDKDARNPQGVGSLWSMRLWGPAVVG